MALWDVGAKSQKCPGCGSNLFFDSNFQKMACKACGSFYNPDTMSMDFQLKVMDKEEASRDDSRQEIKCDSCGAVVVTDETTSATCCSFCGSPAIINRRLTNDFRPDVIIPFKFDVKEAGAKFANWAKGFKKAPRNFHSGGTISGIRGVYVPFWLIDAECHLDFSDNNENTAKDFNLSRVPFDGASKISNALMEAIEPFEYSELVPYNDAYLHGYQAQRYDLSAVDMTDRIGHRLNEYIQTVYGKIHKSTSYGYNTYDFSYVGNLSQLYALLPVYTLNYKYNGEEYQYVINGQTGEVQGMKVPYSKIYNLGKVIKNGLIIGGTGLLVLAVVGALVFGVVQVLRFGMSVRELVGNYSYKDDIWQVVFFAIALGVIISVTAIKFILSKFDYWFFVQNDKYELIEEKPDVTEYFDTRSVRNPKKVNRNPLDFD